MIFAGDAKFAVSDVQKNKGGKFMHYGKLVSGSLAVGDAVTTSIDTDRRKAIMRAHSATHLLDYALRVVLGDHAHQAGSLVEPDRLRYDFTHFSAVTAEELVKISRLVSELILDGMNVETKEMPIAEAKKLGAIALFGEKYGDVVRVVNMGGKSIELCGGTHVDNTAKVGPFRIVSESSVASGVRRIEAVTGLAFISMVDEMNMRIDIWQGVMTSNNVPELIRKYGGKISFMGDIDSAKVDYEGWTKEVVQAEVDRACAECGTLYFIPNASQGLPMSTFPGVYEALSEAIDNCSKRYFPAQNG